MMLGNQLETASLGMLSISILGAVCLVVTRSPVLGEKHHVMTKSRASRWLVSPVSAIKKRIRAWMFLIHGPSIIQEEFDKAGSGIPFHIDVPENRYLVVSSWKHIKEIDAAPDSVLSLQGAAKEILQPKHTMSSFNWLDKRGVEGTPLIRTLRTLLTNHLPEVLPDIRRKMTGVLKSHQPSNHQESKPFQLALYPTVVQAIARSNALAFFGDDLSRNDKFLKAAISFIEQTVLIAEILRLLPTSLSEPVGRFLSKRLNASQVIFETLHPIAMERLDERERKKLGQTAPEHKDCIQWVMESSPRSKPWTAERIVYELIALWFGSVHITSTTLCFAIHDLCLHPEYLAPIRKEIQSIGWDKFDKAGGKCFPLLDSFMKESARLTPVETVSTRRKALQDFQLSDGLKVPAGEWICTAARGMGSDASTYTRSNEFHGFRFVDAAVLNNLTDPKLQDIPTPKKPSAFTEYADWQLWGTGKCACPGRYYASAIMKTMLGLLITNYDLELTDPKARRFFAWRTFIYPFPTTTVTLRPRATT